MSRMHNKLQQVGLAHDRHHPLDQGGVRLTTFVPVRFKKRGAKKVVVGPDGVANPVSVDATQAIPPHHDTCLIKTLARGHYWQHLLDTGAMPDTTEIAAREGLSKITVNETLRLISLAPGIVEAALNGTLPRTVSRYLFLRASPPLGWEEQQRMVASFGAEK